MKVIEFLHQHQNHIAEIISLVIALLMAVFRIFPTKNGEGLLTKIDKGFNKTLDFLKIPNPTKKDE